MMPLLILGLHQPGNDIDVYLRPLVDDLKQLWSPGVEDVFDGYKQERLWMISSPEEFVVPTDPLGESELSSIREGLAAVVLSQVINKKGEFHYANLSSVN